MTIKQYPDRAEILNADGDVVAVLSPVVPPAVVPDITPLVDGLAQAMGIDPSAVDRSAL